MKIVGLVGPKRSGKDTAAAALVEQRGYVRVGFADAVKELALRINPRIRQLCSACDLDWGGAPEALSEYVAEYGWERAKGVPEVRRFLQELGTGVRDIVGEDSWLDAWGRRIVATSDRPDPDIVVPDVRFTNEAEFLRDDPDVRALLVRVTRPGLDLSDTHVSETEQAGIRCDAEVINDGTPEQLHAKVLALVDGWSTS